MISPCQHVLLCAGCALPQIGQCDLLSCRLCINRPVCAVQAGLALSVRNLISFCVIMFATSRVGGYGSVALATNEIMRQVYLFAIQSMGALDVSVQALVAARLGRVRHGLTAHGTPCMEIWPAPHTARPLAILACTNHMCHGVAVQGKGHRLPSQQLHHKKHVCQLLAAAAGACLCTAMENCALAGPCMLTCMRCANATSARCQSCAFITTRSLCRGTRQGQRQCSCGSCKSPSASQPLSLSPYFCSVLHYQGYSRRMPPSSLWLDVICPSWHTRWCAPYLCMRMTRTNVAHCSAPMPHSPPNHSA